MVQYAHTPWRDHVELLNVRNQFYPGRLQPKRDAIRTSAAFAQSHDSAELDKKDAVARVAVWMHRGSCPHIVESTGLINAAILNDVQQSKSESTSSSTAVRLAYSAAFSRFVTGLLDSHQDKQQKQTMWSVAKSIGLPASLVDTRHKCTHEQLPSLSKLRCVAQSALAWMWDYYWRHLAEDAGVIDAGHIGLKATLLAHIRSVNTTDVEAFRRSLRQWNDMDILGALSEIGESAQDPVILLGSLQLSHQILGGDPQAAAHDRERGTASSPGNVGAVPDEIAQPAWQSACSANDGPVAFPIGKPVRSTGQAKGWSKPATQWKAKPIGMI